MQPQVTYLGHKVSKEGIQPMDDKVEAITNAPSPTNVSELKSYLGLINYYQKFLPNLSSLLAPLHLIGCCRRKSVGIGAEKKNKRLKNQSCPEVIKTIGIFRRPKGTDIILWCISKRFGSSALKQDGGWFWTSYLFCFSNTDTGWEKLHKFGEGGSIHSVWS